MSYFPFLLGNCRFEESGERHRRGDLEVEATAAHGAVDHGALEGLQLGQVLVDEIGNLDKGCRASLACRCAYHVHACCMCMCMLHVHVHVTWHVHVIFCTCRRGFHLAVSRPIRSAWPRRAAALGCSWHCRGLQEAILSRGTGVSQTALPPPSSFHLQRHSRATFSNCILPLATAQRHRYVCLHRAQLHRAMHTAYFPPSQVTPHGSRLTSAWTRACSPSPQKGSPRQMPFCSPSFSVAAYLPEMGTFPPAR